MPKSMAKTTRPVKTLQPTRTTPPPKPLREAGIVGVQPANGTVRACVAQRGELLRHRVISADGRDVAVTTTAMSQEFVTGVYPVQQGYLVMVCQPLYEVCSSSGEAARKQHAQLVRLLGEAGVRVVRARRHTKEHEQAEHGVALGATA